MPSTPAFIAAIEDVVARWRSHRRLSRTRRIVSDLPRHIRKDIGWPEAVPDRRDPRWS